MRAALSLIAASAGLLGCGDPLQDATYRGEPLLTMEGEILLKRALGDDADLLRVSILWTFQAEETTDSSDLSIETAFPSRYTLDLFLPPPDEVFTTSLDGQSRFAAGYPLLYLDEDGDGSWDIGAEKVLGGTAGTYILYTADGFFNLDGEELFAPGYAGTEIAPCDTQGPARLAPSEVTEVNLDISPEFLDARRDLNCDGELEEWAALCQAGCDLGDEQVGPDGGPYDGGGGGGEN